MAAQPQGKQTPLHDSSPACENEIKGSKRMECQCKLFGDGYFIPNNNIFTLSDRLLSQKWTPALQDRLTEVAACMKDVLIKCVFRHYSYILSTHEKKK